jgi:hypothetical protein
VYVHVLFFVNSKTLRTTPAMAAGITNRLWEVADMVTVLETWETSAV